MYVWYVYMYVDNSIFICISAKFSKQITDIYECIHLYPYVYLNAHTRRCTYTYVIYIIRGPGMIIH